MPTQPIGPLELALLRVPCTSELRDSLQLVFREADAQICSLLSGHEHGAQQQMAFLSRELKTCALALRAAADDLLSKGYAQSARTYKKASDQALEAARNA